jgi:hypothetical protein
MREYRLYTSSTRSMEVFNSWLHRRLQKLTRDDVKHFHYVQHSREPLLKEKDETQLHSECHLPDYCLLGNDAMYFGTGISEDADSTFITTLLQR